jgi:hypothetical protein
MKITTYVKLNHAHESLLDDFQNIEVKKSKTDIIATIKTFTGQKVVLTVNECGIINNIELID